jgi:uncharacterized protein (DUF1330 family)
MKVIGLIKLKDTAAFETYRGQVGATVARYGGEIAFRGAFSEIFWNEIACGEFDAYVELLFPSRDAAVAWSTRGREQDIRACRRARCLAARAAAAIAVRARTARGAVVGAQ